MPDPMTALLREQAPDWRLVAREQAAPVREFHANKITDEYRLLLAQARVLEERYGR